MWSFLLRRVALMVPTFFGITLLCFLLLRLTPGSPVSAKMEMGLRAEAVGQEQIERQRAYFDLDKPWYQQYGKLVGRIVTLELGNRWQDGRPIADVLAEALPVTLLLSFVSLLLAYAVAIPVGIHSAVKQYSLQDRAITVLLFVLYSLPTPWVGIMLLVVFASGSVLDCGWSELPGCFPLQGVRSFEGWEQQTALGATLDVAYHLVLPVVVLTYGSFAALSRYMRTAMLDTIRQDYVRTARAKGLSERVVVYKHALRNSLIPIVTLLGLQLPYLISGSVIVEIIFGLPGMGQVAFDALNGRDYPVVLQVVAFTSLLTMVGMFLSDVMYAVVDPRIRLGGRS